MKKTKLLLLSVMVSFSISAQEIVNLILVGNNGVTEDIKQATSFIVIKQYPNSFQRLDYGLGLPLKKLRTYSDTALKILHGAYYEYSLSGTLTLMGQYRDNKKNKEWYYYNDTGKVILQENYDMGIMIKRINPDTLKGKTIPVISKVETEAMYKKTDNDWREYITRNLKQDVAEKSAKGGTIKVGFTVNTEGKCVDVHLKRSAEFVLDEEGIRIIETAPLWTPAVQNGRKVNAYRVQPITFAVSED